MAGGEHTIDRRSFLSSLALIGVEVAQRRLPAGRSMRDHAEKPPADWPVYRHDRALSGVSPGKGRLVAPRVRWEYFLGVPYEATATYRSPIDTASGRSDLVDLDGDGRLERIVIDGHTLRVTDEGGKQLWTYTVDGL